VAAALAAAAAAASRTEVVTVPAPVRCSRRHGYRHQGWWPQGYEEVGPHHADVGEPVPAPSGQAVPFPGQADGREVQQGALRARGGRGAAGRARAESTLGTGPRPQWRHSGWLLSRSSFPRAGCAEASVHVEGQPPADLPQGHQQVSGARGQRGASLHLHLIAAACCERASARAHSDSARGSWLAALASAALLVPGGGSLTAPPFLHLRRTRLQLSSAPSPTTCVSLRCRS